MTAAIQIRGLEQRMALILPAGTVVAPWRRLEDVVAEQRRAAFNFVKGGKDV